MGAGNDRHGRHREACKQYDEVPSHEILCLRARRSPLQYRKRERPAYRAVNASREAAIRPFNVMGLVRLPLPSCARLPSSADSPNPSYAVHPIQYILSKNAWFSLVRIFDGNAVLIMYYMHGVYEQDIGDRGVIPDCYSFLILGNS